MTAGHIKTRAGAPCCIQHAAAKDRLLAVFSAELQTALHGLLGGIELLQTTALHGEQQDLAAALQRSTAAMLGIVGDALDLARLDLGDLQTEAEPFELHELLRSCIELQAQMARGKGLEVRLDIEAGIATTVLGDAMRLRQVCMSLLGFAIKATPSGGVTMHVRGGRGGMVQFCIADTSPGLGPVARARLLETRPRANCPERHGMAGMALGVSRDLIALMGGELQISSVIAKGTAFEFALPLASAATAASTSQQSLPPRQRYECRVLVVDDTAGNRLVMKNMLQRLGCFVVTAENGSEAIQQVRAQSFDIVLMDCLMPVLDGCAAARVIRAQGGRLATLPIVAMAAGGEPYDRGRCEAVGMKDRLAKPIRLRDLEMLLRRLLPDGAR